VTREEAQRAVLAALVHTSEREVHWLLLSDQKLFGRGSAAQWLQPLDNQPDLAEAIDAFCARFARLQDTLGDKLLPRALGVLREPVRGFLDNLQRAERAGLIGSSVSFVAARDLRNRFAHDYTSRLEVLATLLDEAHGLVPFLVDTQQALAARLRAA
jgi:hypothetical protein